MEIYFINSTKLKCRLDWISEIKKDENKALTLLYKLYRTDSIHWISRKYKVDIDQAKEIFQTSVVVLYDNIISGKLIEFSVNIKSYLYGICKFKAMEYKRHRNRINLYDNDESIVFNQAEETQDKLELEASIDSINQMLRSIGDPCKSLLQLYYYKKMSMADITRLMGYKNADTTKNQKYKCIKRLRSLFSK